jgi:putative membrane protein
MIVKRNFNPLRVINYVKAELIFSISLSSFAYLLNRYELISIKIPFSVSAILGSALAIFIAFRNNSSYSRCWEARGLWGGIVNSSRVLARLIITFADSHSRQAGYRPERSAAFKKEMVYLCIAWAHALRLHLRRQSDWPALQPFLTEEDFKECMRSRNKPNYLHLMAGRKIYAAMADGTLAGFDSFQLEGQLLALANYQGGCERIKNTPLLRQYDYFTRIFLYAFMLVLPFSLYPDLHKTTGTALLIPISLLISFIFAIIARVGEVNEDPFENRITDVPMSALCTTIETDLKEMLGEEDLPEPAAAENGFLF